MALSVTHKLKNALHGSATELQSQCWIDSILDFLQWKKTHLVLSFSVFELMTRMHNLELLFVNGKFVAQFLAQSSGFFHNFTTLLSIQPVGVLRLFSPFA